MMRSPHDLDVVQRPDRDVHGGVTSVDVESATVSVGTVLDDSTFPAVAAPAIARPKMNAMLFGAAPQIAEPISNNKMIARNTYLGV